LHTNDTHSQVEPLEEGKRDAKFAGYARRMGLIDKMRKDDPQLLLFDAGDFSQGTPYFNFYHGRIEVDAMNRMGYDAITLGNHEFDYGVDTLAVVLKDAQFDVVCANYDVTNSPLENIVKPYTIIKRSNMRIGVFGIGVNPQSLIAERNF
jgi:5'-nucleotidase